MQSEGTGHTGRDAVLSTAQKYILFELDDSLYAVPSEYVRSITISMEITHMVEAEPQFLGVITYLGDTIPVMSLRSFFGLQAYADELHEFMQHRIGDHERWVHTLEQSVLDGTEFTLAIDPHKCAFGKWYDTFETDNNMLEMHLKKIDRPHRAVHETGAHVKELMREGRRDEALEAIEKLKREDYAETMQLLSEAAQAYEEGSREIMIICAWPDGKLALLVDKIVGVDELPSEFPMPPALRDIPCFARLAQQKQGGGLVRVLDIEKIK